MASMLGRNLQLWLGVALLIVGALVLFGGVLSGSLPPVVLAVGVLVLAVGTLLVASGRRGRPV